MNMNRKRIISAVFFGVLAASFFLFQADPNPSDVMSWFETNSPGYYKVLSVEDGDTITVEMSGKGERIRFIGVDTPETHHPSRPVQCFGKAATKFTTNLIADNPVRLEADPTNSNRDRYDRLLRYVYLPDNTLVNQEIVRQGYGFAYLSFPFIKSADFKKFEAEARTQNRGLWSNCEIELEDGNISTNPVS